LNLPLFLFIGSVAILLLGLGWALGKPRERRGLQSDPRWLEEGSQRHLNYLPQVRQALASV